MLKTLLNDLKYFVEDLLQICPVWYFREMNRSSQRDLYSSSLRGASISLCIPHQVDLFIWGGSSICLSHHSSFIRLTLSHNNFLFCSFHLSLFGYILSPFTPFLLFPLSKYKFSLLLDLSILSPFRTFFLSLFDFLPHFVFPLYFILLELFPDHTPVTHKHIQCLCQHNCSRPPGVTHSL